MPPKIDPKDFIKDGFRLDKLSSNNLVTLLIVIIICCTFYFFFTAYQDSVKDMQKQIELLFDRTLKNCQDKMISNQPTNFLNN